MLASYLDYRGCDGGRRRRRGRERVAASNAGAGTREGTDGSSVLSAAAVVSQVDESAEEAFADGFVGQKIQPFWIEEEARKLEGTNFIVNGQFKPFAVRDGNLITGQQQYSGAAAAKVLIEALGV